ncbi:site-specific integrase [Pseudomonas sp. ML96]|uniref:tyrosine-type recombinase/integrase n=1 Tax=Pseudomonas sp. ML96 TaxID=1523503 RepID=UPI00068CF28F|nr:site-specific integrase [Pseudomonas sp. ML96]
MAGERSRRAGVQLRTVAQVMAWWGDRLEANRSVSASYKATMLSLARRQVVPRLGKVTLKQLDRATVDDSLVWPMQAEGLSPHTAHKALQGLLASLDLAAKQKRVERNPLAGVSFKDFWSGKLQPKAAGLLPVAVPELLPKLCGAFERQPVVGMLALTMLANATRIGETCMARRQHISLIDRVWIFPAQNTKTREELVVPITEQMCALLTRYWQALPAARQGSPWVFPGVNGRPLSAKQASALIKELSGGEWTSHDLRKLARTVWTDIGIDYLVGELLLNHSVGTLAKTYIRTTADQLRRQALEQWHAWLDVRGFAVAHGLKSEQTGISTDDD